MSKEKLRALLAEKEKEGKTKYRLIKKIIKCTQNHPLRLGILEDMHVERLASLLKNYETGFNLNIDQYKCDETLLPPLVIESSDELMDSGSSSQPAVLADPAVSANLPDIGFPPEESSSSDCSEYSSSRSSDYLSSCPSQDSLSNVGNGLASAASKASEPVPIEDDFRGATSIRRLAICEQPLPEKTPPTAGTITTPCLLVPILMIMLYVFVRYVSCTTRRRKPSPERDSPRLCEIVIDRS